MMSPHLSRHDSMVTNYTPHPITVYAADKTAVLFTLPSMGVARVLEHRIRADTAMGVLVESAQSIGVVGLPDQAPGISLVVSRAVLFEVPERADLLSPDTGQGAVRDPRGRIVGTTRFICLAAG